MLATLLSESQISLNVPTYSTKKNMASILLFICSIYIWLLSNLLRITNTLKMKTLAQLHNPWSKTYFDIFTNAIIRPIQLNANHNKFGARISLLLHFYSVSNLTFRSLCIWFCNFVVRISVVVNKDNERNHITLDTGC